MKQSFNTSKLYYGFPIFILGYQDKNFGHNITTCSSSYSLGDWLVRLKTELADKNFILIQNGISVENE